MIDLRRLAVLAVAGAAAVVALLLAQSSGGGDEPATVQVRPAEVIETEGAAAEDGALAPDFEASTFSGERLRLSDYRGKAVVLNFWATWCTSCLAEIPELERVSQELSDEGLVVLGVNVADDMGRAERFLRDELGATYASVLDPKQTIAKAYRAPGLPVTVFIAPSGRIEKVIVGGIGYETFDRFALSPSERRTCPPWTSHCP